MEETKPEPSTNVVPLARNLTITLHKGDRLMVGDFPDHVFMLRAGSLALEACLALKRGPTKMRIALLDHRHDFFSEPQALSSHASELEYVALDASEVVAIPKTALNRMLTKPADDTHTIGERIIQLQAQQTQRLLATIISAFLREDSAADREHIALQQVASSVADARHEERQARMKSEQQIEANKKAIIDQLLQEKDELAAELTRERRLRQEAETELRRLTQEFGVSSRVFLETEDRNRALAGSHRDLIQHVLACLGQPPLSDDRLFEIMGTDPVSFRKEESPTDKIPKDQLPRPSTPAPPPQPPRISIRGTAGPEVPTRREGPPPRRPMATLSGLGGYPSSKPPMGSGVMLQAKPETPREPTVELDLKDVEIVPDDDKAPLTLVTPRFTPPSAPPASPLEDEEPELDEDGFPIRQTLVGLGSLVPESIPQNQLLPEFREGYGGKKS